MEWTKTVARRIATMATMRIRPTGNRYSPAKAVMSVHGGSVKSGMTVRVATRRGAPALGRDRQPGRPQVRPWR
jgi:hypothetical protein